MNLIRLTERIWVYPYEEERDRPNLCYIHGDRWSLAADAGHSANHTRDFYGALEKEGLPMPEITVLTHWHWDHTLGMHAIHGLSIANELTNRYLTDFHNRIKDEEPGFSSIWTRPSAGNTETGKRSLSHWQIWFSGEKCCLIPETAL